MSVLILDFVDFAQRSQELAPATLVGELNELTGAFDRIGEQFACERIKTTGDTYLCVSGMHDPGVDHAGGVAHAAVRFLRYLERRNANAETVWQARIGLATGPVVGSVVGGQKYVYDIFGPAVNAALQARAHASAMEALLVPQDGAALPTGLSLHSAEAPEAGPLGLVRLMAEP
ncbi:MAG: adenylate/guanylate cyclase domain-containing protein [Pseudomonadota bacterium]